jgi:replication factor C small subunit
MKRNLLGQNEAYTTLEQVLADPPHLFFSGAYGFGKTTLAQEFLQAYFSQFHLSMEDPEWLYCLSSESDRGIHKVREGVTEFVHHTSSRKGVYRWIWIDDADSLPVVSQQALRRPMETHAHTTRFLFCSRHVGDLIAPLRSRCLHVELEMIALNDLIDPFMEGQIISESMRNFLLSISLSPRHLIQHMNCLKATHSRFDEEAFRGLFSGTSDQRIRELVIAFLQNKTEKVNRLIFEIWNSGISFEDFLTDLSRCSKNIGILPPDLDQKIHEIMIQGWIYYTHGRTHLLDIFSLFRVPLSI